MPDARQPGLRSVLELRHRVLTAVRRFFTGSGYLEVDTPVRIPAPAPEAHIDAEPCGDWYLQTSPEVCMKRLVAAGHPRIFQICKCFRRHERGGRHLPEMTLLEWYTAHADYRAMMGQCEQLLLSIVASLGRGPALTYQGDTVDLSPPWPRLSVKQAFEDFGSADMATALREGRFDDIMGLEIEPRLGLDRPVFLHDYPAACGALARRKPYDPDVVERFELYIHGLELCNAFSELTNPVEQRQRFENEQRRRTQAGKPVYPMPELFLEALAGLPATAGNALGLDRLIMLLADTACIDEVVTFTPEEL